MSSLGELFLLFKCCAQTEERRLRLEDFKKQEEKSNDEKIIEIEVERLKTFKDHPFKVQLDQEILELKDSIEQYGILNPLIVRPMLDGMYEIISGHRRKYAAEMLGYRKVPVIIRVMKDDEAVISMVDSNLQREKICPSEKAFAYKMRNEAIKRKAGRKKCGQVDHNKGIRSVELIGKKGGDSTSQVQRYIKLADLVPELLQMVDDKTLGFTQAVQIAFMKENEQRMVLSAIDYSQCSPSISQVKRLRKLSDEDGITAEVAEDILSEVKSKEVDRVTFTNEQLHRFFPSTYTAQQMKRKILVILKSWTRTYSE